MKRRGHTRAVAGITTGALALLLWGLLGPAGLASAATGGDRCIPASEAVTVHFVLGGSGNPGPGIAGVDLAGFDPASCDGQPVTVTLSGNKAGNPSTPVTELLTTLDSGKNPCTGDSEKSPAVIQNGAIDLAGCETTHDPHTAAFASVHDATRITVAVNGHELPATQGTGILGEQATRPRGTGPGGANGDAQILGIQASRPRPGAQNAGGVLPFTGGPQPVMFWVGLLLVVFGVVSFLVNHVTESRRRILGLVKKDREP